MASHSFSQHLISCEENIQVSEITQIAAQGERRITITSCHWKLGDHLQFLCPFWHVLFCHNLSSIKSLPKRQSKSPFCFGSCKYTSLCSHWRFRHQNPSLWSVKASPHHNFVATHNTSRLRSSPDPSEPLSLGTCSFHRFLALNVVRQLTRQAVFLARS